MKISCVNCFYSILLSHSLTHSPSHLYIEVHHRVCGRSLSSPGGSGVEVLDNNTISMTTRQTDIHTHTHIHVHWLSLTLPVTTLLDPPSPIELKQSEKFNAQLLVACCLLLVVACCLSLTVELIVVTVL
jgi:hypothetical protein